MRRYLVVAVALAAVSTQPGKADQTSGGTPADGIFDLAQADRGQAAYVKECSGCHLTDLSGSNQSPALAGDAFLRRWQGKTVEELFQKLRLTMPQNKPRSLSDAMYIDILAYLLSADGFPAGSAALSNSPTVLQHIVMTNMQ